jgi:hypothetical protein
MTMAILFVRLVGGGIGPKWNLTYLECLKLAHLLKDLGKGVKNEEIRESVPPITRHHSDR